ncbi:MAG TPA: hypothetical protein VMG12_21365 [Polyangiaceae bacterium]|nr:hypothetical protein [Polyangiaceae bacterium]
MKHLKPRRRLAHLLLLLLAFGCQGRGRVHEAQPASYPDAQPSEAPQTAPFASPSEPAPLGEDDSDGYAAPPPPVGSPLTPELEDRAAPKSAARAEGVGSLGSGRATDAPARQRGAERSRPISPRPVPEERPGLATHWGETRYSPARQVDFERAASDRPSTVLELHYNDRAGARRMLPRGEWGRAETWALGGLRISLVDAAGRPLPALRSGSRVIGVGAPGERYALAIENSTAARFEVVASVDGLDVLDGEGASFEKRGYLIGAYSSVLIDGFRRSDAEVAAFRLGDVARSYAASKGQARNVGVVGFALFEERRAAVLEPPRWRDRRWTDEDTQQRRDADPFPGQYARPPVW